MMLKVIGGFLFLLHLFLLGWSVGGMTEWLLPSVPWPSYSNPLFPRWLLFFHWMSVITASSIILLGYLRQWNGTPRAMVFGYAAMAMVCFVETVWFLAGEFKYLAMILENAAYIAILLVLHNPTFRSAHFSKTPARDH
ncbi:MAG TPA: hypothetical protein PKD11_07190 [Pyrinomonadaceae bacterium]|nr:hypothetical protein [Pyrinomonadaceae bacterium]